MNSQVQRLSARLRGESLSLTLELHSLPQGNYIGPDDDLESDVSGDEAQQEQANGAGVSDVEPPLRAYDEDDTAEQPLEGMEVDGECSHIGYSESIAHAC